MKQIKSGLLTLSSAGLILLGACGSEKPTADAGENSTVPAATETADSAPQASSATTTNQSGHNAEPQAGGQVVESGPYHLELVTEKEANGTHIDFFLQKGDNHEAIPGAKVSAQVQLPDGTQKALDLTYDAEGKHYAVLLPEQASGEYKVAILTDINGEKVNGRFTFNR
ncbi:hypothetical protein H6F94_04190 [Leptolyngbya sp. FACHB-261]|nr:hypothetical protein [Leptolyngbya sp. FACHB-261]